MLHDNSDLFETALIEASEGMGYQLRHIYYGLRKVLHPQIDRDDFENYWPPCFSFIFNTSSINVPDEVYARWSQNEEDAK
jgi:hypothetical protein